MFNSSSTNPNVFVANAPHVVILGAGASRAAFPNGDRNGVELPLMCDLIQKAGLEDLLDSYGIPYENRNFEELYDEITSNKLDPSILKIIEGAVYDYFNQMRLPNELTLYDKLILCLRKKDLIATFNWDPFLALAYRRNAHLEELPKLAFLHGNVAIGVCQKDKVKGYKLEKCPKCGKNFQLTRLLYPIENKNYKEDPFIANEWSMLEHYLEKTYFLTLFGYNAPKSDAAAIEIMRDVWKRNEKKEIAEIDIIDIKPHDELKKIWKDFIVRSHYSTKEDFKYSYMSKYPRRTCTAIFMAAMQNQPLQNNRLPDFKASEDLQNWIKPLIAEEILYREKGIRFSGLPCDQIKERSKNPKN